MDQEDHIWSSWSLKSLCNSLVTSKITLQMMHGHSHFINKFFNILLYFGDQGKFLFVAVLQIVSLEHLDAISKPLTNQNSWNALFLKLYWIRRYWFCSLGSIVMLAFHCNFLASRKYATNHTVVGHFNSETLKKCSRIQYCRHSNNTNAHYIEDSYIVEVRNEAYMLI